MVSILSELLGREFVFFDGAMGSILQKKGLGAGQRPDIMNITAPDVVEGVHRLYARAGSDILCTNTFGAGAHALKGTGFTPEEIIRPAVAAARRAAGGRALVALDIGPTGPLIEPFGTLTFDEAYGLFREQAVAGAAAGADLAAIETMSDLLEMKAAILAVLENTDLPVFATMTFDGSGRTFTGCRPESFAVMAESLGAAAVGLNCSLSPDELYPVAEKIAGHTRLPLIIKPNAGLPSGADASYGTDAEAFARQMAPYAALGAKIVGGCCGTTPEYIARLREVYSDLRPSASSGSARGLVCSPSRVERARGLTPAGAGALSAEQAVEDALDQADGGAAVVTVRLPEGIAPSEGADIIRSVQSQSDRPLAVASREPAALAAALRAVAGRAAALIPPGDTALEAVARRYGAVLPAQEK